MGNVTVAITGKLKSFIDDQVVDGRFNSASEYVQALIQGDEKRRAGERLEAMLREGLASPESAWTQDDLTEIRASARTRR